MRARPDEPLETWCQARIESCCIGRASQRHHVLRRSRGGTDDASNTRDLCAHCHEHIHRNPQWSYDNGWLMRGVA